MKFFVPLAESDVQAESVYQSISRFVSAPVSGPRIYKLTWKHKGQVMQCEIGKPLPSYYQTDQEPVLAIFDCGNVYKICTPSRGGIRGEPVLAGKDWQSRTTYFESISA